MAEPPLVSVLIPCRDHAATLGLALASLRAQTHMAWEAIVVDDGSKDAPERVVAACDDPRVQLVRFPESRGAAAARQAALERARGEFVAFLDADDWHHPERFEAQLAQFQEDPELAAVGTGMAIVDAGSRLLGTRGCRGWEGVATSGRPLPRRCGKATVMLRGEVARSGRFDPGLRQGEDGDYLGRVLAGARVRVLPEPLYFYRQDPEGTVARSLRAHALRREQLRGGARPLSAATRLRIFESWLKSGVFRVADRLGLDRMLADSRNDRSSGAQRAEFDRASARVKAEMVPRPLEGDG